MLLPAGDNSERGLLARVERLERTENLAPMSNAAPVAKSAPVAAVAKEKPVVADVAAPVATSEVAAPVAEAAPAKAKPQSSGSFDVAALRRHWPDVIEDVKKKRRLTWSLLSTSAQVLGVDESAITIGIANAGARDSFLRSNSDEILRQAFSDIIGLDLKIEVTVDPSIDSNSLQARGTRGDESPTDATQLTGAALLAKELGAQVIPDSSRK